MAQLKYCQKLDFEGYPNNNLKYKKKWKLNVFKYDFMFIYNNIFTYKEETSCPVP